ncbi:MAG TPA: hypothetical protein VN901_05300 [Candidatus Acidoferrales bacterium]|nr:hypothetical protein [Candidatus Acidoferrales bacterium]
MKRKALAVQSIPEATEKRAKRCQVSGHFPFSVAWIEAPVGPANWRRHVPSRACLVLVLFFGLPAALWAQKQQGSWSDLRGLKVGQGVEVIESSMKRHGGEFVNVSDEVLTLQEKGSDVSVKRENVVRVSTASGARRGEHAVIGLVVGAAGGAGIGAAAGSGSKGWVGLSEGVGALVGIAIGATSGAIVGAVIPAHTTIYRAAPAVATH